jgi:tape measure domain-containing protein
MAAQTTAWVNFNGKDVGVKVSIEGIEKSLNKMQRNGKKDIDSLSASFKNLKSSISQMSGSMGSLPLIGGLGAAGIFAGGKTAVEKFAGRETLETAITFFSKTEDVAKSNLSFLKNTSNSLGIVYDVAADGYKRLLANMSLMNIPMAEQNDKFLKISSAIRAMGLDAGQSESVFRAFGDMMAKGSIQAQELKTQLANAMPGTMGFMSKAVGGDAAKVAKMLDTGAITWAKYGDKLIDIMYNSTKDGLDKAVLTTSAGLARIQNTWDNTMVGIGDAIVRSGALDVISQVGKELEVWVSANKEMIASSIKGGVDFIKNGFEWAVSHKDQIGSLIDNMAKFFVIIKAADLVMSFSNPLALAATSMGAIGVAIWSAVDALKEAKAFEKTNKTTNKVSSMNADASAWQGLSNIVVGAVKLTYDPVSAIPQIGVGLAQTGTSVAQSALSTYDWVTRKEGEKAGFSYKSAEEIGRMNMSMQKWLNPSEFKQDIPTYDKSVPDFMPSQYGLKSQRDTVNADQNADKLAIAVKSAMENWTVQVNSADNKLKIVTASGTPVQPIPMNIVRQD